MNLYNLLAVSDLQISRSVLIRLQVVVIFGLHST